MDRLDVGYIRSCAENVVGLALQIVYWVENLGLNGVDIGFEDSDAFVEDGSGGFVAGYNGIQFLSDLTSELYQNLPPGSVITHALPCPANTLLRCQLQLPSIPANK